MSRKHKFVPSAKYQIQFPVRSGILPFVCDGNRAKKGSAVPKTLTKDFRIEWLQILDENGNCDQSLRPSLTNEQIKVLYENLVFARAFDEKAFKLQREGRLGTYASIIGQEAAQVGSAFALDPGDWMFPSFREPGASFVRGLPLRMILQYWSGDERGSIIPKGQNDFPITIPVY